MPDVLDQLRALAGNTVGQPEPLDALRARTKRRRRRQQVVVLPLVALALLGGGLVATALLDDEPSDEGQVVTVDDPQPTTTTTSAPETSSTLAADPIALGDLPGGYRHLISGPGGIVVITPAGNPPARLVTDRPTGIAFGVGDGRVVAQYATSGVPNPIVVLDGQGERAIEPPALVDGGGGMQLLDAGVLDGRSVALLAAYGGAGPAQWDVRLFRVDLETLEQTDLGSVGGWEEGVDMARLLDDGDMVVMLSGTGATPRVERRTAEGDVEWTAPDLGDGTTDSFVGTMTVDGDTVLVAEYRYLECLCHEVRLRAFDVATGEQVQLERDRPEGDQILTLRGPGLPTLDAACSWRIEVVEDGLICTSTYAGLIHVDRDGLATRVPGAPEGPDATLTTWRLDA